MLYVPGVGSADVSLSKTRAIVEFDTFLVDKKGLISAVEDAGYEATVK